MSTIPPGWLGSVIQTQGAKARAATDMQTEGAAQAERVGGDTFAERLQDVIESNDRDSQVYSDAEGTGSQGRPSSEPQQENTDAEDESPSPAPGLDIEA